MKILITGATGFIGKNLARRLVKKGHEVIAGGRSLHKLKDLSEKVKTVYFDLNKKEALQKILKDEKPDLVYHTAALVESLSIDKLREVNVKGTENVLCASFSNGIKKVIYISSVSVATGNKEVPLTEEMPFNATNLYGQSKLEAEKVALEYRKKGLKIAIIRPCMIYGENEPHALGGMILALRLRMLPVFGNGENRLHLVGIDNVVDLLILCLSKEEAYEGSYFVADKEVLSIKEVLNYMAKVIGAKPPFIIPEKMADIFKKIPLVGKRISFCMKDRVYSIKRLEEKLGYVPRVSVYDGLKKAVLSFTEK